MKAFREMQHRCFTKNYQNIPFRIRSLGHSNITHQDTDPKIIRNFVELYWGIDGEGEFIIDGEKCVLHPGEVCFYDYGDFHNIRAITDFFHYRWLTFDGPATSLIWKGLKLPKTPRFVGECPEQLYCKLAHEILDYSSDGLKKASATGFSILMLAALSGKLTTEQAGYSERARKMIDENFNNPLFNINTLAEQMKINRSQLSRKFSSDYGIGLAQYLINKRIQHGIQRICSTTLKIKDIAEESGFSDPNYFVKCINKYNETPVRKLRKLIS